MPDWRTRSDYAFVKSADERRLAWEFLRRNPDYRRLFAEREAVVRAAGPSIDAAALAQLRQIDDALTRMGPMDPKPPSADDPPMLLGNMGVSFFNRATWLTGRRAYESSFARKDRSVWVEFYLDAPIAPQLRMTRTVLEDHYPELKALSRRRNPNRRLLAQYLRLLDAKDLGVTIPAMGAVLFPSANNEKPERPRDKRVRAMLRAATGLRDDGYRALLAWKK